MTIHEKLIKVQSSLKVPKSQRNTFGNYQYRSCEDILEALKPLLKEHGLFLTLTDEVVLVGTRYYVKATAIVSEAHESGDPTRCAVARVEAYAREEESKKGMDGSQITGAASSYARKYALNGLFCIDDTKDSDATNKHDKEEPKLPKKKEPIMATPQMIEEIEKVTKELGGTLEQVYETYKITGKPTMEQGQKIITALWDKRKKLTKELDQKA